MLGGWTVIGAGLDSMRGLGLSLIKNGSSTLILRGTRFFKETGLSVIVAAWRPVLESKPTLASSLASTDRQLRAKHAVQNVAQRH